MAHAQCLSPVPASLLNLRSWNPMDSWTLPPGYPPRLLPRTGSHTGLSVSKCILFSWTAISGISLLSPSPFLGLNMVTALPSLPTPQPVYLSPEGLSPLSPP